MNSIHPLPSLPDMPGSWHKRKLKALLRSGGFLPLTALCLLVGVLPFITVFMDSFFHDFFGERSFAGFENYVYLFKDRAFLLSGGITLVWALSSTMLSLSAGYSLAVLLFESGRGFRFLYAVLLVPWGIPAFISVPLWRMLLHGAGGDSLVSAITGLGINLLTDPGAAFAAALFVDSWMNVPAVVFVLYAALRSLPSSSIEAAKLDGACRSQMSLHVYLPQIAGSIMALGGLGFVKELKEFNVPFLLTAGGPPMLSGITGRSIVGATTTLEVFLFDLFRASDDYGIPAAYAAVLALIILGFIGVGLGISRIWARNRSLRDARSRGKKIQGKGFHERLYRCTGISRVCTFPFPGLPVLDAVILACRFVLAAGSVLSCALILYALIRTSLSRLSSTYIDSFLPRFFTLENFIRIFSEDSMGRAFLNSFIVATVTAILIPVLIVPAAVSLGSFTRRTRSGIFTVLQALGAAGGMHSLIPLFIVFRSLGLLDSYIPLVLVYLYHAAPFTLFTTAAFLEKFPRQIVEAAILEGASPVSRFFRILVPLAAPAIVTASMVAFLSAWNGFLVPLLFLGDDSMYTVGIKLHGYVGSVASGSPDWNRFAAASIVNLLIVGGLFLRFRAPLRGKALSEGE